MPDDVQWKDQDGDVRADVDGPSDVEEGCYIDTVARGLPFPDLVSGCTLENLDESGCGVVEKHEEKQQSYQTVGSTLSLWSEDFGVQQQD